jgi:tRNA (cytidine32/uridine32-2'-O)-methyltransferase
MKNMGLSRLYLVQPEMFPHGDAIARAAGATDVLDGACVVDTLEEALVGCSVVLGTSARDRRIPWPLLDPRECAQTSLHHAETGGEVALVFGREYAGLTNEELQRCNFHVHIPSDPEFGSLNLAAAVQVLVYEVRMAWLTLQGRPTKMNKVESTAMLNTQSVTVEELELFYRHLEETLIDIRFLDPEKPRHLMSRLRRLYGRSAVTKLEMNILRGILTETQKVARGDKCKTDDI